MLRADAAVVLAKTLTIPRPLDRCYGSIGSDRRQGYCSSCALLRPTRASPQRTSTRPYFICTYRDMIFFGRGAMSTQSCNKFCRCTGYAVYARPYPPLRLPLFISDKDSVDFRFTLLQVVCRGPLEWYPASPPKRVSSFVLCGAPQSQHRWTRWSWQAELKQCSFQPQINKGYVHRSHYRPLHDRLAELQRRKSENLTRARLAAETCNPDLTFTPKVAPPPEPEPARCAASRGPGRVQQEGVLSGLARAAWRCW